MEYDFRYEHFKSIYDFERVLNERPVSAPFEGHETSHDKGRDSFFKTVDFDEAQNLLEKGWDAKIGDIEDEMKKFLRLVVVKKSKQVKSVAGFAPCVPNAIRGVPKSMFATRILPKKETKRSVHIVFNNSANAQTEADDLIKSGLTVLKLAYILDRHGIRVKIDMVPKMSYNNESVYGCTVNIKEYRQPFNLLKIAYPLAHVSFFRRHGFRYLETLPEIKNKGFVGGYGSSMIYADKKIKDAYFKFAGFLSDDVVYIDFKDVSESGFEYQKLAEAKGIEV